MRHFFSLLMLLSLASFSLQGQEKSATKIPDEDFYLMPSFTEGTVYLRGQSPAQGKINICAVDQTLRFIDDSGTELAANDPDGISRVQIDTVWFMRSSGAFYRMYPINLELGIAVRKDTRIIRDVKKGAYGMTDQTSSIQQYRSLYNDTSAQLLNSEKPVYYRVSETICLYYRDAIVKFTKASLKKVFPDHKDEIDAYFKSGKPYPSTVEEARAIIAPWLQ